MSAKQKHVVNLWRCYEAMLTGTEPLFDAATTKVEIAIAEAASKVAARLHRRLVAIAGPSYREILSDWDCGLAPLPNI